MVTAFLVASTMTTPLYGKLSDIFGRKPAFALSPYDLSRQGPLYVLSRTMTELIVFVQGLGAGGLSLCPETVVGDLVPPREQGMGLFAARSPPVASRARARGHDHRRAVPGTWIFVNLPVGAVAIVLIGVGLKHRSSHVARRVDYRRIVAQRRDVLRLARTELGRHNLRLVLDDRRIGRRHPLATLRGEQAYHHDCSAVRSSC